MIAAERTVLALLAAGHSRRFGGFKLDADLWGKPLGRHVTDALADVPFLTRVAVTGGAALDYHTLGYDVLRNPDPQRDQASSLRLAAGRAIDLRADALLIALADMPLITAAHVGRLLGAAVGEDAVVASTDGASPTPPALFGSARLPLLLTLHGDTGARDLIRGGHLVAAGPGELTDVDTRADLERLRPTMGAGACFPTTGSG